MHLDPSKSPAELLMQTQLGGWIRFIGNLPFIGIGLCTSTIVMFIGVAILGDVGHDAAGAVVALLALGAGIAAGVFCKRRFADWYWQQTRGITIISSTWHTTAPAVAATKPWHQDFDPVALARAHAKPIGLAVAVLAVLGIGGRALSSYQDEQRQLTERRAAQQERGRRDREAREAYAAGKRQAAADRQREAEARMQQHASRVAEARQLKQAFLDQLPKAAQRYCDRTSKNDLQCIEFTWKAKALFEQQVSQRCSTYAESECLAFLRNPLRKDAH